MSKKKKLNLADFHVHSRGSADGVYNIEELLKRAKKYKVQYMTIADHNYFDDIINFLKMNNLPLGRASHMINGVNLVPGVEVTCRVDGVKNYKGNDAKIHLLVQAPMLQANSRLVRLMKIKHGNDLAVDFGLLFNVARLKGIEIDPDAVSNFLIQKRLFFDEGFSSFGRDDVIEFFNSQGITIAKSMKEYNKLFDNVPHAERLNLSASDVIQIAHNSGGLVILAHPKTNLSRTNNKKELIDFLLEHEIDGFEVMTRAMDRPTFDLISRCCKRHELRNDIIFSGGSDFHVSNQYSRIGEFNNIPLTTSSQSQLIYEIQKLNKARRQSVVTHRDYTMPLSFSEMNGVIRKYDEQAHKINEIYSEAKRMVLDNVTFRDSDKSYVDYLREQGIYDETEFHN